MERNKLLRVTQINAVHLDNEIYKALEQEIEKCKQFLPPGFTAPFDEELLLLIKLALLYQSVVKSNATFGQKLLSIEYENLSQTKKVFYVGLNCLDYFKNKFASSEAQGGFQEFVKKTAFAVVVCSFINNTLFLRQGNKPLLIERILNLNQVYTKNVQREFSSKYMTRELLWNGFIEILLYVIPLVNYHKIKRTIKNFNPLRGKPSFMVTKNRKFTLETRCAHCGEYPIHPHHMGCPHIFCYVCLKGNQMADSMYECPLCDYTSTNGLCEPAVVM